MPGYRAHLVAGAVSFAIAMSLLGCMISWQRGIECLIFSLLGSLFPDIDTKSKGQRLFYQLLAVAYLVLILLNRWAMLIVLSCIALIPMLVHHRTLLHKPWFVIVVVGVILGYCLLFVPHMSVPVAWDSLFFVIGAWSHLILDRGMRGAFRW